MSEKRCTRCGTLKPPSEFHRSKSAPDGLSTRCKQCVREYDQYRWRNAESIRARQANRRAEYEALRAEGKRRCSQCEKILAIEDFHNDKDMLDGKCPACKECVCENRRQSYRANPEKNRQAGRDQYHKHREKRRAYARGYREQNPQKIRETMRKVHERYYQDESNRLVRAERARKWYQDNRERHLAGGEKWRSANYARVKLYRRRRKAWVKGAEGSYTPDDVFALLKEQNELCTYHNLNSSCTINIAQSYTVDHIIPISRGGTNSPDNLQLLCDHCNKSKGARTHEEYLAWLLANAL